MPLSTIKHLLKKRGTLALGVWLLTMGAVLYLWSDVGQRSPILGFIERTEVQVDSSETARIKNVAVQPGQHVRVGQTVAVLDPTAIDAQIGIAQANLVRIEAELTARSARDQLRALRAEHGVNQAHDRIRLSLANAESELQTTKTELQATRKQRATLQTLLSRKMAVNNDLDEAQARENALRIKLRGETATVQLLKTQLSAANKRSEALPERVTALSMAQLEAERTVVQRRLDQLAVRRQTLTLRAPCDGSVAMVHQHPGEMATVGSPVITLVREQTDRVVACVYEGEPSTLREGSPVTLHARNGGSKILHGHILTLGSGISPLPERCWPQPRQRVWGRKIVVLLDEPSDVVAGEGFNLRIISDGELIQKTAHASPITKKQTANGDTPRLMGIPSNLAAITRIEPSGLIWVAKHSRYVIVSDDTGKADSDTDHAPWLFTMNAHGQFDDAPLQIRGANRFNDLESIAAGPGGELYVLSSQSYSKRGKRKRSRMVFGRLTPAGHSYRLSGAVTLATLIDQLSLERRQALGIEHTRALNIEGMTSTSDGGLLLGLKTPLDASGRALIWYMRSPDRLFATGQLEDAELRLWGRVALTVSADKQRVRGGISELLKLPDESLVIAATASGIRPKTQDGSLWHVTDTKHDNNQLITASRFRVFKKRKPEGLALSPHPGRIAVAFDEGNQPATWMEVPWPR